MKNVFFACSVLFLSRVAFAEESIFTQYKNLALKIENTALKGDALQNIAMMREDNALLTNLGVKIMDLYGQKFTQCAEQYSAFKANLPSLPSLSAEDIHTKYHDGEDLPKAPGLCYFGRSLVVHPAMTAARFTHDPVTASDLDLIAEESREVAEHVQTVAKSIAGQ